MKKISYKSSKWSKRIIKLYKNDEIHQRKKEMDETDASQFDEKKKAIIRCIEYQSLAECFYLVEEYDECKLMLDKLVDTTISVLSLNKIDNVTDYVTQKAIDKLKCGSIEVLIAYVLGRFDEVKEYLIYSDIESIISNIKDEEIHGMYNAIEQKDKELFITYLDNRIKGIRKQSVDYTIILDFWTIVLMKLARKNGMDIKEKYIELGYIEGKSKYLFD